MSDDVITVIEASPIRRVLAIAMMMFLGGLLVYVAMTTPAELHWKAFLLLLGGLSLWLAERMNKATQTHLVLTKSGLSDSNGEVLAAFEDIQMVSRGMLAFKPSNGFTLNLKSKKSPARWRPGLWWRFGSRVGIGGVTAASQSKPAAQMIEAMLVERAMAEDA
ncbi:MAG: hypothetical protein JXQ85_13735 [Cognatishimia sp.]|uniref:hypothetical protein n=1 Tax=Cognatishimia sp. TaxID=2211648 RepID=UPI003B8C33E9